MKEYSFNSIDSLMFSLLSYVDLGGIVPNNKREYIYLDDYYEDATGNDVIIELYYEAYENLFIYLFNKETINFGDCPVTDKFKQKFNSRYYKYKRV